MSNIIDKIRVSGTDYTLSATSSGGNPTVELTQAEYDALVSAGTVSADTYYIITDAQAGDLTQYWTSAQTSSAITQAVSGKANSNDVYLKSETSGATEIATALSAKLDSTAYTPTDLSNYYQKSETSGATEISTALATKADTATTYTKTEVDTALATKQTTLTAGTGISIVDNVISAEGGGGSITIDPTLDSGSTNPVENQALWDELRLGGAGLVETTIEWSGSESTNYPSGSTEIKLEFTSECDADISFNTENGGSLGNVLIQYHPQWSLVNVNTSNFQGASYEISGSTITISYPSVTNVAKLSTRIYDYATVKAIYNDPLIVLKDQVTGNTAAIKTKVDTTTFNSYASSVDSALGGKLNVSDYVIDSALNVASRNPVQNQALYSELRLSDGGEAETTIEWSGSESTNYPNGCTKIKVEGITSNSMNRINFFADGGSSLGYITVSNWGSISVDTSGFQGASYEISGSTVIISYPTVTTVTKLDVSDSTKYTYKAITSSTTPLKDQVVANTTALGGLSLVKLTQAQYDALVTKDSNTLYVIVN